MALAFTSGLLILSIVVGIVVIPVLDAELQRLTAKRTAANDEQRPPASRRAM